MQRIRTLLLALAALMATLLPVTAQEEQTWRASISGQIEALRAEDGEGALAFASEPFRTQFEGNGRAFLLAVVQTGYVPIIQSRTHSFGDFERLSETVVQQTVDLIGENQRLYRAIYRMVEEVDEGWRVEGVVLAPIAGIGI